jgi:hypothetical protein
MKVLLLIYTAVGGLALLGTTANALLIWTVWNDYQATADEAALMKLVGALDAAGIELIGEGAVSSDGGRGIRLKSVPVADGPSALAK